MLNEPTYRFLVKTKSSVWPRFQVHSSQILKTVKDATCDKHQHVEPQSWILEDYLEMFKIKTVKMYLKYPKAWF